MDVLEDPFDVVVHEVPGGLWVIGCWDADQGLWISPLDEALRFCQPTLEAFAAHPEITKYRTRADAEAYAARLLCWDCE